MKFLSLVVLILPGVLSTSVALADPGDTITIEEVETPYWVLDEIENSIIENRESNFENTQFISYQDEEDDDLPPLDLDDEDVFPPLDDGSGNGNGKTQPPTSGGIPPMDPKGGTGGNGGKKGDQNGNGQGQGNNDPFPPSDPNDPFPPSDPNDPFPPGDPNNPFPPVDPNDPFPPITDPIGGGLPGFGDPFFPEPGFGFGTGPVAILDQLVNLGHKVWRIIQQNQPVIEANYKYANAIPKGTTATDLEYFSPIVHKSHRIKVRNKMDRVVVDLTYTTVHRYGGKYDGQGSFLERVSIVPSKIVASYNYKVNFDVINVTVANVGSKEEPVASMGVDALIEYGSTFKKTSRRIMFEFRGDSPKVGQYRVD